MLVALPSAIAFGVAIFSPLGGTYAAQGAIAGILGAAFAMLVAGSVMLARGNVTLELAPEPPLVRNYRCSNDKLFQALGYRPKRSVLESVDEMVSRFTQPGVLSFTHPRYYNIDWMLLLIEVHAGLHPFEYVFRRGEGQRLAV